MNITSLIEKKKLGYELSDDEIKWIIQAYTTGNIEDYHMSAFAMAVCFCGMSDAETAALTYAMAESGDMIDLSDFGDISADKHSTGGVGDKTSLIIAPIVAALGAKVAKMSGRGLGHTGGTIDKLESIPGYLTSLSANEFIDCTNECGIALISATGNIAPADKKLYALRDVTATVDSIPLIASSIMSKKLAAGAKNIVIDVKCGSGAFMKSYADAVELAEKMVAIGKHCNRNIAAVITDMSRPLGYAIGNALEIREAIDVLMCTGPADLTEVCIKLSSELLSLVFGGAWEERVKETLNDGRAYATFEKWISRQGGDINSLPNAAPFSKEVICESDGYISIMDSKRIGEAAMYLGAGRTKITDSIDMSAGIVLSKKTGDTVKRGEVIATLYASNNDKLESGYNTFKSALVFSSDKPEDIPLIYEIIE